MKLLVTGGAGFIGTNYIRHILTETDHSVVNIDALTYAGCRENLSEFENSDRYSFVEGNITDRELVSDVVKEVDCIVHFAAESHVDRSITSAIEFVRTNVEGTLVLLEAARTYGNKRFHHISTDEVFGSLEETGKFTETTPYQPRSPYAASKASSDHFVRAYYHTHGLPVTISNCSNNYGPYQHPEKFIPHSITNVLEGKPIEVYGTGVQVRDWIHVADHVAGIQRVLEQGTIGATYCFGGESELTNMDVAHLIADMMEVDTSTIVSVADRKGHDFRYAIDNTHARDTLGWEPRGDFKTHLRDTIAWYRANTDWWQQFLK